MRKVFMLLMAASAILFAGCTKDSTKGKDPIEKQWSLDVSYPTGPTDILVYDFTTAGKFSWGSSSDNVNWYKSRTVDVTITYSNDEKTAGTYSYYNEATKQTGTYNFKNLTETSAQFQRGGPNDFATFTASNLVAK